jgi:hypothetical protein
VKVNLLIEKKDFEKNRKKEREKKKKKGFRKKSFLGRKQLHRGRVAGIRRQSSKKGNHNNMHAISAEHQKEKKCV